MSTSHQDKNDVFKERETPLDSTVFPTQRYIKTTSSSRFVPGFLNLLEPLAYSSWFLRLKVFNRYLSSSMTFLCALEHSLASSVYVWIFIHRCYSR
jgi:hypothetical protein